jgi:DNA polymerase III gamma/tau subunit
MSLYQKYRPQTLDEIQGNDEVVESLKSMLSNLDKCSHTFLLHGPTGCGKTTIGRIIAKEVGCVGVDYKEINTADFRGIDMAREVIRNAHLLPIEGTARVWLIDECHKLTNEAQNALLKILEDTPQYAYFILCTTDPWLLIKTIRSRCIQLQMNPLTDQQMFRLLRTVVKGEGEKITQSVYDQIIQDSFGLPRNAIQILESVLNVPAERRLEMAQQTGEVKSESIELCRALISPTPWKKVGGILEGLKEEDAEGIRRHILGYCQSIVLKGGDKAGIASDIIMDFWEPLYNIGHPGLVSVCYKIIKGE